MGHVASQCCCSTEDGPPQARAARRGWVMGSRPLVLFQMAYGPLSWALGKAVGACLCFVVSFFLLGGRVEGGLGPKAGALACKFSQQP